MVSASVLSCGQQSAHVHDQESGGESPSRCSCIYPSSSASSAIWPSSPPPCVFAVETRRPTLITFPAAALGSSGNHREKRTTCRSLFPLFKGVRSSLDAPINGSADLGLSDRHLNTHEPVFTSKQSTFITLSQNFSKFVLTALGLDF